MYNIKRLSEQKHYLFGLDDLAVATILAGVIGAGASIWNAKKQSETNEENLEYNEEMTREQWSRDERAIQTQVQDAQMAGLSPLAVVNGGGATVSQAIPANAQSPNLDLTNMLSMFTSMAGLEEEKRHNIASEENSKYSIDKTAENLEKELRTRIEITGIEDERKASEIQATINNAREKLAQEEYLFTRSENNQYVWKMTERVSGEAQSELDRLQKSLGVTIRTREWTISNKTEFEAWKKAKQKWTEDWVNAIKNAEIRADKESIQTQSSINGGGSIGALGATISGNGGQSSGASKSKDVTRVNTLELTKQLNTFAPYPVPIFTEEYRGK